MAAFEGAVDGGAADVEEFGGLHLLQSALVHINTLLLQAVLEVPELALR